MVDKNILYQKVSIERILMRVKRILMRVKRILMRGQENTAHGKWGLEGGVLKC